MSEDTSPYIEQSPGDLITAENWNELQRRIKADICDKVEDGIEGIKKVPQAGDSEKLDGKTIDELTAEIIRQAVIECKAQSGYLRVFRHLTLDEENLIHHNFEVCPLVDIYALPYFRVVCCEDKQTSPAWTTFYLHNSNEKTLNVTLGDGTKETYDIMPTKEPVWSVPFEDMLQLYKVEADDNAALDAVETAFWDTFCDDPNDGFHDNQYCHSPWFDKCCREEKTVKDLKTSKQWGKLLFQMRPVKLVQFGEDSPTDQAPYYQIQVNQYGSGKEDKHGFDQVGLTLRSLNHPLEYTNVAEPSLAEKIPDFQTELKVMVLLKC